MYFFINLYKLIIYYILKSQKKEDNKKDIFNNFINSYEKKNI